MFKLLLLAMLANPQSPVWDGVEPGVHPSGSALHLNDNIALSWGNTLAAPDVWMDNNGTSWCFTTTSVDGATGTDGDLFCYSLTGNVLAFTSDINTDTGGAQLVIDAGTESDPAIVFGDDDDGSGTGIYRNAADSLSITAGGSRVITTNATNGLTVVTGNGAVIPSAGYYAWSSRAQLKSSADGKMTLHNAANTTNVCLDASTDATLSLFDGDCSGTATLSVGQNKGAATLIKSKTESVTFANDASKVTTGSIIPAGAFVVGVTSRVVTAGAGCTTVDIGIAGKDVDAFADGTAVADATTTTNANGNAGAVWGYNTTDANALSIQPTVAAQEITVTANGGNCTAGVWALTVHYFDVSAATAD